MLGVQAPLAALNPLSPTCPVRLIGICWTESLHARGPGPPQMAPRGSPRQEDVTEAQEGKTTRSRPLWGTLCATGFGSAPVLTSSGAGTQMYSSLVVLFRASKQNSEFLTKLERDYSPPPPSTRWQGTNWWQRASEEMQGKAEEAERVWICLTCLTGEDAPGDDCKGLLPHFGEFFLFLRPLRLLIPEVILCRMNFTWDKSKDGLQFQLLLQVCDPEMKNEFDNLRSIVLWWIEKETITEHLLSL